MKIFSDARGIISSLYKNRILLNEYARREIFEAHAGQLFGGAWVFIHSFSLMAVYGFIFSVVFQIRLKGNMDMPLDYTTYILSGIVPWLAIQSSLSRTSNALIAGASLVKQVVFPVEILPAKAAIGTLIPLFFSLIVLIAYGIWVGGGVRSMILMAPFVIILHCVWILGIGYILASLSVFFRDVREVVQLLSFIGIFTLPVLYIPSAIPEAFRFVLYINPFSYLIWCYQDVFYFGEFRHPVEWFVAMGLGLMFVLVGSRIFTRLKPYFGDSL